MYCHNDSTLSEVSSSGIVVVYYNQKMQNSEHSLTITKYYPVSANCFRFHDDCYKIEIVLLNHPHHININISDIIFNMEYAISIHSQTCDGFNKVTIGNCNFTNVMFTGDVELAAMINMYFTSCNAVYYENGQMNKIDIVKCHFNNNFNFDGHLSRYVMTVYKDYYSYNGVILHISDSEICGNNDVAFLISNTDDIPLQPIYIHFNNVRFVLIVLFANDNFLLNLHGVVLQLEGFIIFTEIEVDSVLIFSDETHVYANGYVEFSNIRAFSIVQSKSIYLITNTLVNVTSNIALSSLFKRDNGADSLYPPCLLQYVGNAYNYNKEVDAISHLNISIIIDDSEFSHFCENKYCISHCSWSNYTISNKFIPLDVNRAAIKNLNNNSTLITDRKDICHCLQNGQYDCYVDEIKSIYPGQTVHLSLINTLGSDMFITVHTGLPTSCRVGKNSELVQLLYSNCTKLQFTIQSNMRWPYAWCELFLSYSSTEAAVFYVNFLPCPPGFGLNKLEGYCQCDPILTLILITDCNINNQTVLRPGNSWVCITSNYTYQASLYCPSNYCLPYSSYLNLSSPDSQCKFNRTGLLCGECQNGLSTVFGTSRCKHCSDTFLSITVAIALVGIALLILLFVLNLTVTDGTINAFILYVNIVSINSPIIFTHQSTALAHVFISLANLDLGFEICFYDGMDDYVKMWLQLAFPFYLISIATLLIIVSRYSTKVQRLTAQRVLAVLATLFLLSYTKILRTVSNVLFFYATITDLPSNKTTVVWSVDANVSLFGAKFTILFIACLILLIIIIPFNVVLTFTRTLSRHRLINHFKPLLDAFQGPYKNQYYFWPGLQLVIRAVFFGLSSLDKNINLPIGLVLLAAMLGIHGYVRPFKSSFRNIQELVFIFNLSVLFAFTQFNKPIAIDVMVNLSVFIASAYFVMILLNNLWLYQCRLEPTSCKYNRVTKILTRMHQFIISKWIQLNKINRSHNNNVQNIPLRNVVPEVAYNLKEYREPLIGQDN